jgi:signal recognition particle GTPase
MDYLFYICNLINKQKEIMIKNYTLNEMGESEVFAIIKDIDDTLLNDNFYANLVNKVGQAIEDEFCYEERVKVIHDEKTLKSVIFPYENNTSIFYMSFNCFDEDGEEYIRDVELKQIAIY